MNTFETMMAALQMQTVEKKYIGKPISVFSPELLEVLRVSYPEGPEPNLESLEELNVICAMQKIGELAELLCTSDVNREHCARWSKMFSAYYESDIGKEVKPNNHGYVSPVELRDGVNKAIANLYRAANELVYARALARDHHNEHCPKCSTDLENGQGAEAKPVVDVDDDPFSSDELN